MLVNVGFSTPELRSQIWNTLDQLAKHRGIELVEITQPNSLYFTSEPCQIKVLTLVSLHSEMRDCDITLKEVRDDLLEMLLCWHRERQSLEEMRTHRHTLGNLIVILLSKVMRLEGKIPKEEIEGIEKLHSRFSDLYGEFEKINVKKYK